jgi:hypothetical protein
MVSLQAAIDYFRGHDGLDNIASILESHWFGLYILKLSISY